MPSVKIKADAQQSTSTETQNVGAVPGHATGESSLSWTHLGRPVQHWQPRGNRMGGMQCRHRRTRDSMATVALHGRAHFLCVRST